MSAFFQSMRNLRTPPPSPSLRAIDGVNGNTPPRDSDPQGHALHNVERQKKLAEQDLDYYLGASSLHCLLAIFIIMMSMALTCALDPATMAGPAKNPGESLYIKNRVRGGTTMYTPRAAYALKSKFTKVEYVESHWTMLTIALAYGICTCVLCYTVKCSIDKAALESEKKFGTPDEDQLTKLKSGNYVFYLTYWMNITHVIFSTMGSIVATWFAAYMLDYLVHAVFNTDREEALFDAFQVAVSVTNAKFLFELIPQFAFHWYASHMAVSWKLLTMWVTALFYALLGVYHVFMQPHDFHNDQADTTNNWNIAQNSAVQMSRDITSFTFWDMVLGAISPKIANTGNSVTRGILMLSVKTKMIPEMDKTVFNHKDDGQMQQHWVGTFWVYYTIHIVSLLSTLIALTFWRIFSHKKAANKMPSNGSLATRVSDVFDHESDAWSTRLNILKSPWAWELLKCNDYTWFISCLVVMASTMSYLITGPSLLSVMSWMEVAMLLVCFMPILMAIPTAFLKAKDIYDKWTAPAAPAANAANAVRNQNQNRRGAGRRRIQVD